jgi:hypothetical protein
MAELEQGYIYESPDGKYIFRRPVGVPYDVNKKEEVDLKTGKPTGRMFSEYPFKTKEELNMERYLEHWTCELCGENTHEVDYDYLGNGTNHLQCELKEEMKNERT